MAYLLYLKMLCQLAPLQVRIYGRSQ